MKPSAQSHAPGSAARKNQKSAHNAISVLTEDHKNVKKMFADFDKLKEGAASDEKKAALVGKICMELRHHAQVEEEIFYPAARAAIDDDDLMDEAEVEHAEAKELIAQLEAMTPSDDLYDAKVKVLGENIDHHVGEEQDDMFPEVRKAKIDLAELGARILARKKELEGSHQ